MTLMVVTKSNATDFSHFSITKTNYVVWHLKLKRYTACWLGYSLQRGALERVGGVTFSMEGIATRSMAIR